MVDASDGQGAHAFISYVRDDAAAVDELERVLATAGIPVWRDIRDLFPGDIWKSRIKNAIQNGTLAFIPVFSAASEARHKSVMREEIRLAIDEYRLMAPDAPFIFPVRLAGDVSVPSYPITATLDLRDINWTDFHGDAKTVQATQLVTQVRRALEAAVDLAAPADVAAQASDGARGALLASAVRAGMTDPGRAADATQMLTEEARHVIKTLSDTDQFPRDDADRLVIAASQRYADLETLTQPLAEGAAELGARGRDPDASLATQLVSSLTREGFLGSGGSPAGGSVGSQWLLSLSKLPAMRVLLAGAVGACATRNATMFGAFAVAPTVELYGRMLPVTSVLSIWDVFAPSWELAQFIDIRQTQPHVEVTDEVLDAYERRNVRRRSTAPASDVLRRGLWTTGSRFTVGEPEFTDLFHRTEALIAATLIDSERERRASDEKFLDWGARNWTGGHAGSERLAQSTLGKRLLAEAQGAGASWWPVAGGLFGGEVDRAEAALAAYAEYAAETTRDRSHF